jgi:hypothetical protein
VLLGKQYSQYVVRSVGMVCPPASGARNACRWSAAVALASFTFSRNDVRLGSAAFSAAQETWSTAAAVVRSSVKGTLLTP